MKSAIIGLGVIAPVHLESIRKQGSRIVAVCDVDIDKAKLFVQKYNLQVQVFSDYKEMLNNTEIDVVHICTPHNLHTEMSIYALEHNINVLCEKPLCILPEDVKIIKSAQSKSKAQLAVCLQNRYNESNLYVKELLSDDQVIGGFGCVVWNRDASYYNSANWRGKWDTEGGGVMINQALHTLDLMQWFVGMPESVIAHISNDTHNNFIEVEDTANGIFESDRAVFNFYATVSSKVDFNVQIMLATKSKRIVITDNNVIVDGAAKEMKTLTAANGKCCYGNGHEKLVHDFYDCVEKNKNFWIDTDEASKVIRLINAMYKSKGEKVMLR